MKLPFRAHIAHLIVAFLFTVIVFPIAVAANKVSADEFTERVQPFAKKYCSECHNQKKANGGLDLTRYQKNADVVADFRHWSNVVEFIQGGEMPPPEEENQPTISERERVVLAVTQVLSTAAKKNAGDPGIVLPRRLSNTEYDLSLRDLMGVEVGVTTDFPADPAGGEGFDNTGEALTMSPNLLKKYLSAAQQASNHLVLKTDGVSFAPFPVTSYNERKKLTELAIIDFYKRHDVDTFEYLVAAWQYRYREDRSVKIHDWAEQRGVSGKYLGALSITLEEASNSSGYLKQLGEKWDAVPAPEEAERIPEELRDVERFIRFCKSQFFDLNKNLIRASAGNWPIGQLDFRAKTAAKRDAYDSSRMQSEVFLRFDKLKQPKSDKDRQEVSLTVRLDVAIEGSRDSYVVFRRPLFSKSGNLPKDKNDEAKHEVVTLRQFLSQEMPALAKKLNFGRHPRGDALDADSFVVKAPTRIDIQLNSRMLTQLDGKHLMMNCELDPIHSKEGSVFIQHATNKPLDDAYSTDGQMLIHNESELVKSVVEANQRFCQTFPNRFFYVHKDRGLAAGFHLVEGFFRDDQPLVEKVLDDKEAKELDRLWRELEFVTNSAETLLRGFVWFERSERHVLHDERFDFLRPEDPLLVEDELLTRFEKVYLGKMNVKLLPDSLEPEKPSAQYDMIHGFFEQIREGLSNRKLLVKEAEKTALRDIEQLAKRAYRRPLEAREKESLHSLYQTLRKQGQGVEGALRGVMTAILMSPDFCYRYTESPATEKVASLSDQALASRLSYFLWSSIPDDELVRLADQQQLNKDEVLRAQTLRMLKDEKIDSFAREFLGQWLRYRDYLSKDPINAEAFRDYNDDLRLAMFEEPVRVATELIQNDKPITDLLTTDETFVNGVLAKHYGGDIWTQYRSGLAEWLTERKQRELTVPDNPEETWIKVAGLRQAGRGGLFGMGVILAKNSAGERTSPVKRGFWTVHHLLGKHFPPPPADVPELPPGEKEATKTIRELMADHTANAKCALCHVHFDSLGLAMEGFDPIGRARTKDLAGRPIDNVATLPNGQTAQGIPDLIDYIDEHRREDFVRTMCRKFLGYALGRSVVLSDQPLLDEMHAELKRNEYRFSVMFETVVRSPQFRKRRGKQLVTLN